MRIISGLYRGRKLELPKGRDIRPTSDKIRGAIFNALQAQNVLEGARIMDCFAGTGALGLEALSRGAASCLFIDDNVTALGLAKTNVTMLGVTAYAQVLQKNVLTLEPCHDPLQKKTLVFLDPPYRKDLVTPVIKRLLEGRWLEPKCWIVVECDKADDPQWPTECTLQSQKIYGDTKVIFLIYLP